MLPERKRHIITIIMIMNAAAVATGIVRVVVGIMIAMSMHVAADTMTPMSMHAAVDIMPTVMKKTMVMVETKRKRQFFCWVQPCC